ncbi:hypothetical protein HG263_02890 [Pseudoalteromonas sp. JBTF-M23]|uniref:Uncharacterized protein n=1 Tax=Pseudoalteromonas caenipelagi TaxID=2726988 RepID=A0A849VC03_9GAMM|nr:hypothetical protein [Pseudoalteromonas caenipelagi]NOU49494.1 hypothetical protein [Pseudoalteromonas caenipelagi]
MATINNAIQEMVDHLVDKMRSNEKLTAEEQTLVSNAIQKLSSSANLEAALVAVAEEHLDEATGHLTSASDIVKELQAKLLEQSDNLGLLPELETKFNEITSSLVTNVANTLADLPKQLIDPTYKLGEPEFRLDYYDNTTSSIFKSSDGYGVYNSINLVNYDESTFCGYYDAGSQTKAANPATIVLIEADGTVSKAVQPSSISSLNGADRLGILVLPSNHTALFTFAPSTKELTIYKANSFTVESVQETDYFKIYQDKASKSLFTVDAGILHEFDGTRWVQKTEHVFSNESQFESWAITHQLLPLHEQTILPKASSEQISNDLRGFGHAHDCLLVKRPQIQLEVALHQGRYSQIPLVGEQKLVKYNQSILTHATNSYPYTKSFKSRVLLPAMNLPIKATLESVAPSNDYNSNNSVYHGHGNPYIVGYSPIHNALLVSQYFRFLTPTGSAFTQQACRVYFA